MWGAMPYLDVGHPQEANVEHTVGHEAHQVQGQEIEAQTNNTAKGREDEAGRGKIWEHWSGKGQRSWHTGKEGSAGHKASTALRSLSVSVDAT